MADCTPHPVDTIVGANIRRIRKSLGISQERLAVGLGVTFQQLQKYERGTNRVSASKLVGIALGLGVLVIDLFDGIPHADGDRPAAAPDPAHLAAREALALPEGATLALAYARLTPTQRRLLRQVAEAMLKAPKELVIEPLCGDPVCDACGQPKAGA